MKNFVGLRSTALSILLQVTYRTVTPQDFSPLRHRLLILPRLSFYEPKRISKRGSGSKKLTGKSDVILGIHSDRAEELNILIRDPEVRCIISTIGGNNSSALLPYIDYQALSGSKIIIGILTSGSFIGDHAQTGLITFYGPLWLHHLVSFPLWLMRLFLRLNLCSVPCLRYHIAIRCLKPGLM